MKPKMMVITNVDYYFTDKTTDEIMSTNFWRYPLTEIWGNGNDPVRETEVIQKEIIHGRRMVHRSKGIDIWVGATKEVQNILGLQYRLYDRMRDDLKIAENALSKLRAKKEKEQSRKWWKIFYQNVELQWLLIDQKIDNMCEKTKRDMEEQLHPRTAPPPEKVGDYFILSNLPADGHDRSWYSEMFDKARDTEFRNNYMTVPE